MEFRLDAEGDWVAGLDCGHRQHARHRPPFQVRPWVLEEAGRASHLGTTIDCPLCDRCEAPDALRFVRRSAEWDASSLEAGVPTPLAPAPEPHLTQAEHGGDPACWAGLFCPACGRALEEGHASDCPFDDDGR